VKKICIMGMGYIGLPTASLLANRGYLVHGVDVNQNVIDTINNGDIHIIEPELSDLVRTAVNKNFLSAHTEPAEANIFMIAVPTPFHPDKLNKHTNTPVPNIDYIVNATKKIAPYIRPGNLVLLESTSPVGTTDIVVDILKKEGVDVNNIYVAHSPERVLPGCIIRELVENDRVVGGVDEASTKKAVEFYRTFVDGKVLETTAKTAEMAKLAENSFRDVNIAFANELSFMCDELDIDVWDLISLSNRHPRVDILNPGPGVGGHCIAVDPWFLVDSAPGSSQLIMTARRVNDRKPFWVVDKVEDVIKINNLTSPVVICLGLSYKADIDDIRESPSTVIIQEMISRGVNNILIVEPNIEKIPNDLFNLNEKSSVGLIKDIYSGIDKSDIVLVLVGHKEFKEINFELVRNKYIINTIGKQHEF
jgi:UDP-N-acetyl-D-mannosaminuronic acid dehydrogenase